MFTVKVYRTKFIGDPGKSIHQDRVSIYQGRSVEIADSGITVFGMSGTDEEAWIPRPNVEVPEADDTDWRVSQVIVENAAGKTTEVIRG